MKHALQCANYSSANLQLTLLALQATPIDTKLPSPAELLYQCQLRTIIPAEICNPDPAALQVREWIDTHSDAFRSQGDKHCKSLAPLYAGQPVATYDTFHKIWIPSTVVHVLPKDSYQVCTSNGTVYHHTRWHLHECSVQPADTCRHHNSHTAGFCQTPHLCAKACTCQACIASTAYACCTCNSKATDHSCPKCHLCIYACDTQCSPCAAQEIRSCSHSTQVPDTGDMTVLLPMRRGPLTWNDPRLCHLANAHLGKGH